MMLPYNIVCNHSFAKPLPVTLFKVNGITMIIWLSYAVTSISNKSFQVGKFCRFQQPIYVIFDLFGLDKSKEN